MYQREFRNHERFTEKSDDKMRDRCSTDDTPLSMIDTKESYVNMWDVGRRKVAGIENPR